MARDEKPSDPALKTTVDEPVEPSAGRMIGVYRVVRELGHGGMGTVYLAARADDQFQKRVAIKVVRGLDSEEIVRHFRRERQILAALDHLNIAKLLDGGTTDDGLPYFVMERVEGEPIDAFCDGRKLTVHERLKLFQQVCAAVQYAHQNLVVHRDLKPKNILVDAQGVPKLLDFGIAKLLNPEISGEAATGTVLAMTPEYASPEQMRGQPITTATDVYSLGVVLYELLTGHRPYGRQARDSLELMRAVCEEEAERPSTAVGRTVERRLPSGGVQTTTPETASRTREGTPERLKRRLRGDLDNIVLMALRKEPQRRYRSVEALSEDIRRYLEGRPVTAHSATAWYRTRKFVQRNALGVGAAAALFLLAVGFGVVTTVQSHKIARERNKAERLSDFMVGLFKVSDPSEARGNAVTAREILDKGVERISTELKEEPETRAMLMASMGNVYASMGLLKEARPLLEQALNIRRGVISQGHPDLAGNLSDLGWVEQQLGDFSGAEEHLREAIAIERSQSRGKSVFLAKALNGLGGVMMSKSDYTAARDLFREALQIRKEVLGPDHPDVTRSLNNLGAVLFAVGDYAGAESAFRECLEQDRRRLGKDHPNVLSRMTNLAGVLAVKGDLDEAESLQREALALARRLYGNEAPRVGLALFNLGWTLSQKKDYAAAEALVREAIAISSKVLGPENPVTADRSAFLAEILLKTGRPEEAERLAQSALQIHQKTLAPESKNVADSERVLGRCLVALRRFEEAEPLLLKSQSVLATTYPRTLEAREALSALVSLYDAWGKPDKAAQYRVLSNEEPVAPHQPE